MTATKPATPLPWDTADYWLDLARTERRFAEHERNSLRHGTSESIRIRLQNADEYEAKARALLAKMEAA